jgi:hypothetical protein
MKSRKRKPRKARGVLSIRTLEQLVDEAIVDAYGEEEQLGALFTAIEDNLALPFDTEVLGMPVTVQGVALSPHDEILAVCRRGSTKARVPILDLRLPDPPPPGSKWIAAYRHWLGQSSSGASEE